MANVSGGGILGNYYRGRWNGNYAITISNCCSYGETQYGICCMPSFYYNMIQQCYWLFDINRNYGPYNGTTDDSSITGCSYYARGTSSCTLSSSNKDLVETLNSGRPSESKKKWSYEIVDGFARPILINEQ